MNCPAQHSPCCVGRFGDVAASGLGLGRPGFAGFGFCDFGA